ncbi:MAG: DNA translocase FtsK [Phycisphaerae bacterium]|nr:DNA translocase FtsK [Phycisphaerae bacterium]
MVRTSRTDERQAALRFCLLALGWLGCLFAWASILSFDVADPPNTTVWRPPPTALNNACGTVGAGLAYLAFKYFGIGVYPLLFLVNVAVLAWSKRVRLKDLWLRFIGLAMVVTACAAAGSLVLENSASYLITGPGGVLGTATASLLTGSLQTFGTALLLTLAFVVGLVLAADNLLVTLFRWLRWATVRSRPVLARSGSAVVSAGTAVANGVSTLSARRNTAEADKADSPAAAPAQSQQLAFKPDREPEQNENEGPVQEEAYSEEPVVSADEPVDADEAESGAAEEAVEAAASPGPVVTEVGRKLAARKMPSRPTPRRISDDDYELPPVSMLEQPIPMDRAMIEGLCREKAYTLEQTLNEFRLEVQVVAIETGPVITVFELKLAPGIKVSQIVSLSNDMARALKAPAVRVVAPLPGKNTIGIEVPNIDKEKVRLRDVMEMAGSRSEKFNLPLFLGKDASGQPLLADLTHMPHLLIAGTTGSGKSVCISSLIMSSLMTRSPSEVNMILIDPKVVELAMYKDVPHLICPIVTEISKAEAILDWASTKMDERYALLAEAGVKDIRSYNRLGYAGLKERLNPASDDEMEQIPVRLPYIVIMIDELADLMMSSAKEVEFYLCRIAQKSRAVGIHLIVSTQRPQANVVTGLIKSNLPSRIAFRVSSRLDSRIVLDQNGGEVLMGQGDMLFLPPGQSKLVRAQGTFVDDAELRTVVRHCTKQHPQEFCPELVRLPGKEAAGVTERDEFFDAAVDIIIQTKRGSVSLLQRRFNIGYSRASRLIDQMYEAGIVGEYKGSQAREVNVTKEEWEQIKQQRDAEEAVEEPEFQME